MITLYGGAISNYFNKIKLALMEKEIAFLEELVSPSQDEEMLKLSPSGQNPIHQKGRWLLVGITGNTGISG
jgi:glutathione S-transferase